jgi:hypothetical protein
MAENEKGANAGENKSGINETGVDNGNVSESSRPGSTNRDDQISIAREIAQGQKSPAPPSEDEKRQLVAEYVEQAIAEGLVSYDAYAIQKTFPKAFLALTEHINEQAHLPVDVDSLVGIMLYSGRTVVFDFFDKKKVFVNILGADDKWYYTIERLCQSKEDFKDRLHCEIAAFKQAFAELEKILNYNL